MVFLMRWVYMAKGFGKSFDPEVASGLLALAAFFSLTMLIVTPMSAGYRAEI